MATQSKAKLGSDGAALGYWAAARQPLTSLVFISPLLVVYEAGVIVLGPHAVRNGAETWLRAFLEWIGFGQYFLLPALTVGILLGWHYAARQAWRPPRGLFYGMTVESLVLALGLLALLRLQGSLLELHRPAVLQAAPWTEDAGRWAANMIGFLGAGIYEELLFRLILLSLVLAAFHWAGIGPAPGRLLAVLATALVFSSAHYVGPYGDPFAWFSFLFRGMAGVFFALLFLYRGFGIAAGAHAAYDIFVGLL